MPLSVSDGRSSAHALSGKSVSLLLCFPLFTTDFHLCVIQVSLLVVVSCVCGTRHNALAVGRLLASVLLSVVFLLLRLYFTAVL